jgi:hypothetical protein
MKKYLLNDRPEFIKLKDIGAKMEWLDRPMFIRPDDGDKAWVGGVYGPYEAKRHAEYVMSQHGPDMLMLLSQPKEISHEWRFFLIGDEITTGSQYHYFGKKQVEPLYGGMNEFGAFLLMTDILKEVNFRPDPVFAFDIAKSKNKYYLLELSAFNCAGFYAADIKKLTTRVHEYYEARK